MLRRSHTSTVTGGRSWQPPCAHRCTGGCRGVPPAPPPLLVWLLVYYESEVRFVSPHVCGFTCCLCLDPTWHPSTSPSCCVLAWEPGGWGSHAAEDGPQASSSAQSSIAGFLPTNQPRIILSEFHPIFPRGLWGASSYGTKWAIPFSALRDKSL